MRALALLSICAGAASAVCAAVLLSCISRLDLYLQGGLFDLDTIVQGRLHEVIAVPALWTQYVLSLELRAFVHLRAAFTMACLLGAVALALRWRGRFEWASYGLLSIATGLAAYTVGYLRLETGAVPATASGLWLAWMLNCLFYGALVGILCGFAGLGGRPAPEYVISRVQYGRARTDPDEEPEPARS